MPLKLLRIIVVLALTASTAAYAQPPAQGAPQRGGGRRGGGALQRPQRDVTRTTPTGTGVISGKIVAADSGRAVKRARVIVSGGGRPHAATTDEQGRFRVAALAAGTYTIRATKTGFVDAVYGERRALRAGTPVELAEGQQVADINLKLARGGVVTGRVLDEDGEPLARAMVTVLRQQYVRGEKQLTPAGSDQSDDRGQFRVFGLPPGDYFVSATAGGLDRIRPLLDLAGGIEQAPETSGYAATYYPGVVSAADAARLKVAAAQEVTGIDFQLQIVPLATVKGIVTAGGGLVMLVPAGAGSLGGGAGRGGGRGAIGALLGGAQALRAATRPDGTFSIPNVPPGKYTIIARTDGGPDSTGPRAAIEPLVVIGEEVTVTLTPTAGVQVGGTITLEAAATPPPKGFAGFRVTASPLDGGATLPRLGRPSEPGDNGHFAVTDVMAGNYIIRATAPRGWTMKAVYLDGRDVTDQPIEVKGNNITGLNVIFTDRVSGLSGAVRDQRGTPAEGMIVIAFPSDEKLWMPQSRQIVTGRTDASGAYKLGTLPAGDYLVIAMDEADVEQGEWFDPAFLDQIKDKATRVKVGEGEQKTQDLKPS